MNNLLSKIHQLEQIKSLPDFLAYADEVKESLIAYASVGVIRLDEFQDLENFRKGILNTRLSKIEQDLEQKNIRKDDSDIKKMFVEKISKAYQNTQESHSIVQETYGLDLEDSTVTPFYNMGVTGDFGGVYDSEKYAFPRHIENYQLISTPQGVVPVLRAVPFDGGIAGIDWVTFSFEQEKLGKQLAQIALADVEFGVGEAIETYLDQWLFEIFGFGIGQKREKGMHFYKYAYELQDNLGLVLYGHRSGRVSVQINGTGCALARNGWHKQLHEFLGSCKSPKLNRVDLAFDDFNGEHITVDLADDWDTHDGFWCGGRNPEINKLGDWKRINGKGRTLTIGNRTGGKFARIYERGKKEGDCFSLWTRAEVEFKSTDRYIPIDILLYPSSYFKGAYPAFERLCDELEKDYIMPTKMEIVKKQSIINWDKAIQITKHQFGKYIRQFRKVYDDVELLNILSSDKDVIPKRLKFSATAVIQSIRINQPIPKTLDELPLFVGVSGVNKSIYQECVNAI